MYGLPLDYEATAVHRADWLEVQLAAGGVPCVSIDAFTDYLREAPADDSEDEVVTGDEGKWSRARQLSEEAFKEIRTRAAWLGDRYPIEFDDVEAIGWADACASSRLYRFLVLLRAKQMLGGMMNGGAPNPGYLFEELVTLATGEYLGKGQAVRFGVANGQRGAELPINLQDAIFELARRMHEAPAEAVPGGAGDKRADAIGWRPFGDKRPGQLVVVAQATITKGEWQMKEIPSKWENGRLIQFVAYPLPAVAFVESMSLYSDDFFRGGDFRSVPFDRLRILSLLTDNNIEPAILQGMTEWTEWAISKLPE